MKKYFVLIEVIISLLLLYGTAHATTWYVHPNSKLNSIQAALDSCATDDTVLVAPGVYNEWLNWPNTQGIDLISEYGPDTTEIWTNGFSVPAIWITTMVDSTTFISGFTITSHDNAGIVCDSSSPTIIDNVITWCQEGPGIVCYNSSPIIINNIIDFNRNYNSPGGGISCYQSSPIIRNNLIINNHAEMGAGIYCVVSSPLISGNTIINNQSVVNGVGGIWCDWYSSPLIYNNTIVDNFGGSIGCFRYSSPHISNCTISSNTYGDGIACVEYSSPLIDSCTISNNYGHGIVCADSANPIINYNDITDNGAYGVFNYDSSFIIDAQYNWWGDASGPGGAGPGMGDSVSQWVDYIPWLTAPFGIVEEIARPVTYNTPSATIFSGPLFLPEGKECRVFDITGRTVIPDKIKPGIYFIEIEGVVTQKVVKVR